MRACAPPARRGLSAQLHCGTRRETKMTDRYTKTVLTIIGLALLALVFQNGFQRAGAQLGSCGGIADNPCYVKVYLDCGGRSCPIRLEP